VRELFVGSFYENLQKVATKLLTSKGAKITFTRQVETGFTPATGAKTYSSFSYTGYGAKFGYQLSEIDGEIVKRGDARLLLEKTTVAPKIGDSAKLGTVNYRIMDIETTEPAGEVVMYTCRLRK